MGPAPPGGSGTIDVTPQNVADAAKDFAKAQSDLSDVWSRVSDALNANAGMAGNDEVARRFNEKYGPGVQAAWKAFEKAIITHGGISTGLTTTANNFIKADHHSAAGKSRGSPPLFPREPVFSDGTITSPDSAVGPGHSALPGPLAKFWPNADTGKVRAVGRAWHAAATDIDGINGRVNGTISGLNTGKNDDTTEAINDFWSTVYQPGNSRTILAGAQQICKALGDACDRYAETIDAAHSKMKSALVGAGIAIGLTTAIGIGLSIFTLGGSDAAAAEADAAEAEAILGPIAAETAETVAAETAVAVGADVVADVEVGVAETTTIEAVEAETTEVETALDQEMAEGEGEPTPKIEPSGQYTGDLVKVAKPDADADALAERMGGESRVKFENDPAGREFDAVSDEYIGQAKPGGQQLGSDFRNQAKASFEAAKESGRKVYYHFNGEPAANVIAKLQQYAQRYGVEIKIDTNPF
jgi:hypothetical protein